MGGSGLFSIRFGLRMLAGFRMPREALILGKCLGGRIGVKKCEHWALGQVSL